MTKPEEDFSEYGDKSLQHSLEVSIRRIVMFEEKLVNELTKRNRIIEEKRKRRAEERYGKVAD
jgi:hypothetical protein